MLKCLKEDRQIYAINVAEMPTEPIEDHSDLMDVNAGSNTVPDLINPLGDCQVSSSTDIIDENFWGKNGGNR